jgi:hypothetical protein
MKKYIIRYHEEVAEDELDVYDDIEAYLSENFPDVSDFEITVIEE